MVISKIIDNTYDIRPIINIELNRIPVRALIDTGAESIVWTSNLSILTSLCQPTGTKCSVKGIGGASNLYPVYHGILLIDGDNTGDTKDPIIFNRAEIICTDYVSKDFEIILPYNLFMDFDISIEGNRTSRKFIIDTKIDGKYFFKPKYNNELIVYDISAQLPTGNKFSTLTSLLH